MKEGVFDLDHQFILYLERVGLVMDGLPPVQKIPEIKRAFFGACAQLLLLFQEEIASLPENEGLKKMQDLIDQCGVFWEKEAKKG